MEWLNVIMHPDDLYEMLIRRKLISGASAVLKTLKGISPLTILKVASKGITKLTQFGKCEQASTPTPSVPVDIKCNNGALKMVDDELPTGYKRVLGFKMNNNSYWEIADFPLYGSDTLRFSFDATDGCNVIGAYSGSASGNNYSLYVSTSANYLRYKSGAYNSAIDYDKRYDVELTPTGSSGMKVDSTWTAQTFTTPTNLCIGTTAKSASSAKLKGNLYGNIEIVGRAKFVPCERVSDNVLGYYDTIGEAFYEQASGFSGAISLGYDGNHYSLAVNGTPEVLTVVSETTQTASVGNLLGVGDCKDEHEIVRGDVTRSCGIKVLDGTEEWTTDTYGGYRRMVLQEVLTASGDTLSVICSHYASRSSDARQQPNSIFIAGSGKLVIYVGSSQNFTTADEFNAWLAGQYANGTPVVIVYPLAEPTTEQVTGQHLTAKDTATITANSDHISNIELEVEYWETAEE